MNILAFIFTLWLSFIHLSPLTVACDPPDPAASNPSPATNTAGFRRAEQVPADVSLFIHLEDVATWRREIADRPIAEWFHGFVESGQIRKAWTKLAQAAAVDETMLFDVCFGRSCTLVTRGERQWAVITNLEQAHTARIMQQLKVRILEPRFGMAIAELPEQDLILARRESTLVIGPAQHSHLFDETLSLLHAPRPGESLGHVVRQSTGANLTAAPGRIAIFVRHNADLGGHSLAVADIHGDHLTIEHAANFQTPPFQRDVTRITCDFSPVLLFENRALLALIQPTDVTDGPIETFVTATLGEGLVSASMRRNLGERRLIVVGEAEGRQLEKPVDLLSTTVVCGLQVNDADGAIEQLDAQMIKVAQRMNDLGRGAFLVQTPNIHPGRPGEPREVDLSGASDWFSGGFPIMKNVTLTWTIADGPHGAWFVIGSHRQSLDEVVGTLRQDGAPSRSGAEPIDHAADTRLQNKSPHFQGRFDSCGAGNGLRLARHLRSWGQHADQFAEPERVEEFRTTLRMMSDLAAGMQSCRWQLARPSPREMRLSVQIKLAPPESAQRE